MSNGFVYTVDLSLQDTERRRIRNIKFLSAEGADIEVLYGWLDGMVQNVSHKKTGVNVNSGSKIYQPILPRLLSLRSSFCVSSGSSGITNPGGGVKASYPQ